MKYKIRLDIKLQLGSKTLYRIERISNGEIGGWIESEKNLSQYDNAWVYGDAQVFGNARVFGDAWVYGNAQVSGNARVSGNAQVFGNAWVYGDARVFGDARVYGNAQVFGNARVSSIKEILNFIVPFKFPITITPDNVAIGCKLKTRKEWLKMTKKQAKEMGLEEKYYSKYKALLKAGFAMIPERKKK